MYAVKEIFYSLQGEGYHAGRPAVFCRFTGCNLWSGREVDRATAACRFCDTDFVGTDGVGGGKFATAKALAESIESMWPDAALDHRFVVFTGGEPLLQLDAAVVDQVKSRGFMCAVETNGTLPAPPNLDWVTISPKGIAPIRVERANELKLVFPQPEHTPSDFDALKVEHRFLQPKEEVNREANLEATIRYCMANPAWRLSLQTHKYLGIR